MLWQEAILNKAEVTEQRLKGKVKQAQQFKTDCKGNSLTFSMPQMLLVKYLSHPFALLSYSSFNGNKYISG